MWNNEIEMQFIEYLESLPILWDSNTSNYKDKNLKNVAWNKISDLMEIPVPELQKKKESLFASYRKYRRQVVKSSELGAGENEIYKPKWFAFDTLNSMLGGRHSNQTAIQNMKSESSTWQPDTSIFYEGELYELKRESPTKTKQISSTQNSGSCAVNEAKNTVQNVLSIVEESIKKRDYKSLIEHSDDSEIYAMGLAKKLRMFSEDERLEIMYEIDGIIINRRREKKKSSHLETVCGTATEDPLT